MQGRVARITVSAFVHGLLWIACFVLTSSVLAERPLPPATIVTLGVLVLVVKGGIAAWAGILRDLWRKTALGDLLTLIAFSLAASCALWLALAAVPGLGVPAKAAWLDGALSITLLASLRVATRLAWELPSRLTARSDRPIVIAGRVEMLDTEIRRIHGTRRNEKVVGLVVDGAPLDGARLHGVPVLGFDQLRSLCAGRSVNEVRIVSPVARAVSEKLEPICTQSGIPMRRDGWLPSAGDLAQDLLARPPLELDDRAIYATATGRCLLVTGAGGSIGSGLCRQLLRYRPRTLILLDRSENALFEIERELQPRANGCRLEPQLVDVRDRRAVMRLFAALSPDVVFHAAAHKHVPLVERHPAEAILNNVVGTRNVVDAADEAESDACVFVSTDKAVHPQSVMGATKRIGELYVRHMASTYCDCRFMTVRFGNVLGSSGSVVPIFLEQIRRGGPVTVTHAEMRRFFMSIPEACQLLIQAAAVGTGGDLFVLEMGEPIRIVDLARRLIERAGLRPEVDIPIVFSGPRPGEKLDEQLTFENERTNPTGHPGICRVLSGTPAPEALSAQLDELERLARASDSDGALAIMSEIVPEFRRARPQRQTSRPQWLVAMDVH
jgi:FlaA1/EpsC-like NDP-sugar epimerase